MVLEFVENEKPLNYGDLQIYSFETMGKHT